MSEFKRYSPEDFFSGPELELARAIREGDLARAKALISKANLDLVGKKKMTLLAFAVQETVPVKNDAGNVRYQIVSELVRHGAKPQQSFGLTQDNVAYLAARADSPNLLKALLAGGMSPDLRYDGNTPLLFATADDNLLPQLRVLVENNANVNIKDSLGNTAIFDATRIRQWDAVDYLLAHKADPTITNDVGVSYAKSLSKQLQKTPKDSPQMERIEAIRKKIIDAGAKCADSLTHSLTTDGGWMSRLKIPDLRYDGDTRPLFATANARQPSRMATLTDHRTNANNPNSMGDLN